MQRPPAMSSKRQTGKTIIFAKDTATQSLTPRNARRHPRVNTRTAFQPTLQPVSAAPPYAEPLTPPGCTVLHRRTNAARLAKTRMGQRRTPLRASAASTRTVTAVALPTATKSRAGAARWARAPWWAQFPTRMSVRAAVMSVLSRGACIATSWLITVNAASRVPIQKVPRQTPSPACVGQRHARAQARPECTALRRKTDAVRVQARAQVLLLAVLLLVEGPRVLLLLFI